MADIASSHCHLQGSRLPPRVKRTPDSTLVSNMRCQSSSGISNASLISKMPTLLTRMSTSPTALMIAATPDAVATSPGAAISVALVTAARILPSAASTSPALRPLTATAAPLAASFYAMAKPMPLVEPVTRARNPDKLTCIPKLA